MVFDGVFIYHLIKELNIKISKSRIEKIYQTDASSFMFVLYARKERHHLSIYLSPNHFGLHLTESQERSNISSQFLTTLRKHLEGAILDEIIQYQTDRVIVLNITSYDMIDGPTSKQLIFEAMGKHSNLILVYHDKIIDTFKKMFFLEGRQLLPQAHFEHFPSSKKPFDMMKIKDLISPKHIVDNFMGISPFLSTYLCDQQVTPLNIPLNPTKSITSKKAYFADVFPDHDEKIHYATLSEMLDEKTSHVKPMFLSQQIFIDKQLDKLFKKRSTLELSLEESKEKLGDLELGHLIYQSGFNMDEKLTSIDVNQIIIHLDSNLSLSENAQKFYRNYQKAKKSIQYLNEQLDEVQTLMDHFEELKRYLSFASTDSIFDLENELSSYGFKKTKSISVNLKKSKQKPNFLKIVDEDCVYYIGKNNIQNEYLTHTIAQKEDYWFHVKDATGAHVIVQTKSLSEPILRKAAMLAAYFSSMKDSESIPIDYTQVKFIKKIPKTPGYKVSYKNHKTIYIDIDHDFILKTIK